MKKSRFIRLLSLVCVLALALGFVSASSAEGKKKLTVMVYMCGSNLESENMQGTRTLSSMRASRFNQEEINVVFLAGGSTAWTIGFDPDKLSLGTVGDARVPPTETFPLAAMGDPDTLVFFLNECAERYPADEYILIFWNHGGGPAHGVCQDELYRGDTLSLQEISDALAASPFADKGLDLVVFNACLMGSAELSVVLSPYAKYLVATEDSMYGLSYDWLNGAESRSIVDTAKQIVDESFAYNEDIIERQHATEIDSFCVVDLDTTDELNAAIDAFFENLTQDVIHSNFQEMSAQRRTAVSFGQGASGNASAFDLVDLGDLVRLYRDKDPEAADALLTALDKTVVYRRSANEACTGLTVYHPFLNTEENLLMYRVAVYNGLGFSPAYTTYIQAFSAELTGTRLADWKGLYIKASAKKDQRTLYNMELTEEQAKNLGTAELTALVKNEDGTYSFTWTGSDYTLDGTTLTAEFVHNALCITDTDGNPSIVPLTYSLDQSGNYLIPARLTRFEKETEDGVLPEAVHEGLISCVYDKQTRKMEPGGVLVWDEGMGGYTPAFNTVFDDYDKVELTITRRTETRDDEGILLPFDQWTIAVEDTYGLDIDGTWNFMLLPKQIPEEDLYVAFNVTDSQNNRYLSDLLPAAEGPVTATAVTEYDDANLVVIKNLSVFISNGSLCVSMELSNISDQEATILLENMTLNGIPNEETAEAYGQGENWGLLPDGGDSAILSFVLPAYAYEGIETLSDITFDLTMENAADPDQTFGTVPVHVTLSLDLTGLK